MGKDGLHLSEQELAHVFGYLDEDKSGKVSVEETIDRFEQVGLRFQKKEDMDRFRQQIMQSFDIDGNGKDVTELGLDDFRKQFKTLLGGELMRRFHLSEHETELLPFSL